MVKEGLETQGSDSCAWEIASSETEIIVTVGKAFLPAGGRSWGGVVTAPTAAPRGLLPPQLSSVSLAFPMEVQYFTVFLGRSIVVLSSEALPKLSAPRVCF